jgi:hypothetical protein
VHRGDRIILIEEPRIAFAEAARGYAYLKLAEERLLTSYTLNDLEERFSGDFVRTHRSYLISLSHISHLKLAAVRPSVTVEAAELPISRRHLPSVREKLEATRIRPPNTKTCSGGRISQASSTYRPRPCRRRLARSRATLSPIGAGSIMRASWPPPRPLR